LSRDMADRKLPTIQLLRSEALVAFEKWEASTMKKEY
jgi:hypothetical protein